MRRENENQEIERRTKKTDWRREGKRSREGEGRNKEGKRRREEGMTQYHRMVLNNN